MNNSMTLAQDINNVTINSDRLPFIKEAIKQQIYIKLKDFINFPLKEYIISILISIFVSQINISSYFIESHVVNVLTSKYLTTSKIPLNPPFVVGC